MKKFLMKENTRNIIIIFLVAFIVMLPLFLDKYYKGHDTSYHVANIISLTEQMKDNIISPSNIVGNIANNFGYGTRLFYPPLPHTLSSYINLVFDDVTITLKIVHFLVLFASGITMYFLSKRVSKNDKIGLLSAIIYMLFPYHLSDIYVRDALGECFLFIFPPLIISGLYELFNNNIKRFYPLFIIGYVGGILSHLTMMVYFTVLVLIFLIIKYKDTLKYIKYFIMSSIFILFITSPFLVTLLEHKLLGNYTVFLSGIMAQGIQWGGLILFDYVNLYKNFGTDNIQFYLDLFVLIMLIVTIVNYKKIRNKKYDYIIIFGIISILLSTKIFPWDLLPQSFRMVQFPWRFETYVAICISLFAPLSLSLLKDKKRDIILYTVIYAMTLLSLCNFGFRDNFYLNETDYITSSKDIDYSFGMGWQKEYLPTSTYCNMQYFNNRSNDIIIKSGEGTVNIISNDVPSLTFEVDGEVNIELPRLY